MKSKHFILISAISLTIIGIIMIYSASNIWAEYKLGDKYFYLIRQLIFAVIGLVILFVVYRLDYAILKKHATKIFIFCVLLLIAVLIPGVGLVRGGAQSWIGVGQFSIQPSEFVKIGLILLLSKYLSNHSKDIKKFKNIIGILIILLIIFGLIMMQPDFGTGMVILLSILIMLFIGGLHIKYYIYGGIAGIGGIAFLIISAPYRLQRIFAFLDPWSDPLGAGFQTIQALYALSPGGLFGLGLGQSRQKFFYLPEPQTDFIFAIITEELGFIGAIGIFILFGLIFYHGILIALKSEDLFGSYLAIGITSLLFVQFFINISVVIGLIPVTGITLPFLSYGGSSLVLTLFMVGILASVGRKVEK